LDRSQIRDLLGKAKLLKEVREMLKDDSHVMLSTDAAYQEALEALKDAVSTDSLLKVDDSVTGL